MTASSHIAPDGTAYEVTGREDAPVIALIHGLGLCRHVWDDLLPAFEAEYRVVNYDLFGHGESAPVPGEASLTVYSDQLAALLDHLAIAQAHVVGFSIGGMINRRFALDHGDKLASLVILNSPHDRGEEGQRLVEERARSVREQGAFSTFDAALKRWFTPEVLADATEDGPRPEGGGMAPALGGGSGAIRAASGPGLVREWRGLVDPESYAQAAWVLANGVRELIAPDPPVTAPTLVITCENDSGSTPAMSHTIGSEIAGSTVQIIPHLQHLGLMEDAPAFTTPILEFLRKV